MSFWKRIGLADFDTIVQMQEELFRLKEENHRLIDEKTNDITRFLEKQNNENIVPLAVIQKKVSEEVYRISEKTDESAREVRSLKAENEQLREIIEKYISDSEDADKQIVDKFEKTASNTDAKISNQISDVIEWIEKLKTTIENLEEQLLNVDSLNNENTEQILQELREHRSASMSSVDLKKELDVINEDVINMWKMLKILLVESALTELDKSV